MSTGLRPSGGRILVGLLVRPQGENMTTREEQPPSTFRDYMRQKVADPVEAARYLSAALTEHAVDGNTDAFLIALKTVVDARGGITELARTTGRNRQHLHRVLRVGGNPTLMTLELVLKAVGLQVCVVPVGNQATGEGQ